MRLSFLLPLLAVATLAAPLAAREPATPEQRLGRLEHQVRQVQRQVFPKGQPADTAGLVDDPAATKDSVDTLTTRLDAVERQMSDLVRTSEENSHRLSVMETDLARLRAEQDSRFKSIESGATAAANPTALGDGATPVTVATSAPAATAATAPANPENDGEVAYTKGFDLWNAKKYDAAITQLRTMAAAFPGHRRVSWANNLVGRALLDKGQPRAAAEALLANYRGNPKGDRAADSLFYLGQSLVKLGQPSQACKAYSELQAVYGSTLRAPLKAMLPAALAQSKCG